MPDIDLGIPPFVINWFIQDPLKALATIACVGFVLWSLCSPDAGIDFDGSSDSGDGGGD